MCEEKDYDSASTSNNDSVVKFWRSLWKLKVPGKIKHFQWKACSDALPTKSNLHRPKITPDDLCSRCAKEPETVMHAMWSCEEVQVAWEKYFGCVERGAAAVYSFSDLQDIVKTEPHLLNIFVVTAWKLWNLRNKIRH